MRHMARNLEKTWQGFYPFIGLVMLAERLEPQCIALALAAVVWS